MGISDVISLLGGIALFLFGMSLMGEGLKKVAGSKLELVLYRLSSTPLKGVLLGTGVTAVIQSSSATSVMVVGFVNSGMMKVRQAIGVIMGAILGTSITGWILCLSYIPGGSGLVQLLSTEVLTGLVAVAGIVLRMFSGKTSSRHVGDILLGFAVLMYGMSAMSGAVSPLRESEAFIRILTSFSNPLLGILVGVAFTSILQSASAAVGILQALSITGAITFEIAFPIVMGIAIGAAVPVLVSAIGANRDGRRTALIYLFTGIFGTVIFSAFFYGVNAFSPFPFMETALGPVGIAMVNSLFRIGSILILFPFLRQLEALTGKLIPEKTSEKYNELTAGIERLEERFLVHPALAIEQCRLTINAMAMRSQDNLVVALELIKNFSQKGFQQVVDMEDAVDQYEDHLGTYLVKFTGRELSTAQNEEVSKFLHTIGDFERISDHSVNLLESAEEMHQKEIHFSKDAQEELQVLEDAVQDTLSRTTDAFRKGDLHLASKVEPLEAVVNELVRAIKARHIARLQAGSCSIEYGFVLDDLLTNYERVCDHCSNVAVAQIEVAQDSFDTHAYLNDLRRGNDTKESEEFHRRLDKYRERYLFPDTSMEDMDK